MTDALLGVLGREVLVSSPGELRLAGVAREVLISGVTPVLLGNLVREVLLVSPLSIPGQTLVSLNTG